MRSEARECAFKIIFASLFRPDAELQRGIYKTFDLTEEECAYADRILDCVAEHREQLTEELNEKSVGFSDKRMFPVDKSLLLMALAEIRYFDDVPDVVAIDEAVGLAKRYSTEKSVGYVNGVLAACIAGEGDRLGSLTEGKDADILVMDGHPLDWRSKITHVLIDGQEVTQV